MLFIASLLGGIKILWIDEPHHLLAPGPDRDPKTVFRLKSLLQGPNAVALILTGVPERYQMLIPDRETDRRFTFLHLRPVSNKSEANNLGRYLDECCARVVIARLDDESIIDRLLVANDRNLGQCIEMALRAIRRAQSRPERQLNLADFRRSWKIQSGQFGIGPFDDAPWSILRTELEKMGWSV